MDIKCSFSKGGLIAGAYRVESEPFAAGATSWVCRVRRLDNGRELAMKYPRSDFAAEQRNLDVFRKECDLWLSLGRHPHILPHYYIQDINGLPAVFSEWADGGSLADCIRNGRLYSKGEKEYPDRLLNVALQSMEGLDYAHNRSVIHKDIKPNNIMLTASGTVKLSDFGLAELYREGFTVPYRSPEQARQKPITTATDIYSWAVTVLEMFTGGRCWDDGVIAGRYMSRIIAQPHCKVPEGLVPLLKSCLATDPDSRPDSRRVIAELKKLRTSSLPAYPRFGSDGGIFEVPDTLCRTG